MVEACFIVGLFYFECAQVGLYNFLFGISTEYSPYSHQFIHFLDLPLHLPALKCEHQGRKGQLNEDNGIKVTANKKKTKWGNPEKGVVWLG